ncbi:cysteine desulfurase family protein [Sphingomonas japonica]|uniref:Cysteine desulfurase n=1 Tax=Sphingomonas japonica TaxID=511662 RepID=A0ABX0U3E9_9SPHN|nr:aminotransferase class V-fold PLP-dependent enzyme [Sphingomonas japonica]NIJ25014.1 cysteine desulfurase [Sphingomonas japonica]
MADRLYLDHAATTPMRPVARQALTDALTRWANPSSPHHEGRVARAALEDARTRVRSAYGWKGECIFTSGATEAIQIALARGDSEGCLVSSVEHDAVLRAATKADRLAVGGDGLVDLAALDVKLAEIGEEPLVAVQWGNNETGVLQPLAAIAERVHARSGLLVVDAAQMPVGWDDGDLPVDHADMIAVSGHKRGGPPGIGALFVRDLAHLRPSGGQERGYRGGTENVPGAIAFAAALCAPEDIEGMAELRAMLDQGVEAAGGTVIARASPRNPAIGSYRMPGTSAAAQLIRFDMAGIAVSAGAACSSGSMRPSHVLAQMGIDSAAAGEVVRVSFGLDTSEEDVERFVEQWSAIAHATRDAPTPDLGPTLA